MRFAAFNNSMDNCRRPEKGDFKKAIYTFMLGARGSFKSIKSWRCEIHVDTVVWSKPGQKKSTCSSNIWRWWRNFIIPKCFPSLASSHILPSDKSPHFPLLSTFLNPPQLLLWSLPDILAPSGFIPFHDVTLGILSRPGNFCFWRQATFCVNA